MDFAFFVVNFHYSKDEYNQLTLKEKLFIRKEYENRMVRESTLLRDSVANAVGNVFRKKNKRPTPLWKKRTKKADKQVIRDNMRTIAEIEKKETGWIDQIYKANGWKKKKGES